MSLSDLYCRKGPVIQNVLNLMTFSFIKIYTQSFRNLFTSKSKIISLLPFSPPSECNDRSSTTTRICPSVNIGKTLNEKLHPHT